MPHICRRDVLFAEKTPHPVRGDASRHAVDAAARVDAGAPEVQSGHRQGGATEAIGRAQRVGAHGSRVDVHHAAVDGIQALRKIRRRFHAARDLEFLQDVDVLAGMVDDLLRDARADRIPAFARLDRRRAMGI